MAPVTEINVPPYIIKEFPTLSGKIHYTEYGRPVPIEYWENRPDFHSISIPIVQFLRSSFMGQRIGLRMLGSIEHPGKSVDDLIKIIQEIGHDRYDPKRKDNLYGKIDLNDVELFMLELEIGKELGIDGEEQVKHALNSFYIYPDFPIRVDIGMVYDLAMVKKKMLWYNGEEEIGHTFLDTQNASKAILALFKVL